MKKFAKLLAMVLAVSMVLTMFVGAYNDADKIVDEDKAAAIETVYNAGIMMGDDKGNFNPTAGLRRSEMAKILFALKSAEQKATESDKVFAALNFEDYAEIQDWAKAYIGYGFVNNLIKGVAEGVADANSNLEFAQAAIMLLRTLGLEKEPGTGNTTYTVGTGDDAVTYNWFEGPNAYKNAITAGYAAGLFVLNAEDGTTLDFINYREEITREDVAVMIANAIAIDAASQTPAYALAEQVTALVTDTSVENEDEDDEYTKYDIRVLDGYAGEIEDIKVADYAYKAEDVIGHEVSLVVENEKVLSMEVVDFVYAGTALVSEVELAEVKEEEEVVGYNLEIKGEVIVEDFDAEDYTVITVGDLESAKAYDELNIVINANTIYVEVAPVQFKEFAKDEEAETAEWADGIADTYDAEKKIWKGEYTVTFGGETYKICDEYAALDIAGWYSYQVVDGELVNLKPLEVVELADLDVALNAKEAEYSASYEGNELFVDLLISSEEETANDIKAAIWELAMEGAEDGTYFSVIYDGYVLVDVIFVEDEEEEESDTETIYAFVTNYDAKYDGVKEDDEDTDDVNEAGYYWTFTVELTTIDGEEQKIEFTQQQEAITYAPAEWLDADLAKIVITTTEDNETIVGEALEVTAGYVTKLDLTNKKVSARDIIRTNTVVIRNESVAEFKFVNCTEEEVALTDIEIATEGSATTTKVDGKNVSALSVMVFKFDDQYVVVYDPGFEFGLFNAFLPEAE